MSDLSLPPLSLVPFANEPPATPVVARPVTAATAAGSAPAAPGASAARHPSNAKRPGLLTATAAALANGFAWPTPPDHGYPLPTPLAEAEPCELEGPNGTVSAGQLVGMDLAAGRVLIKLNSSRTALPLKFSQFRRLTLLHPLAPRGSDGVDLLFEATAPLLPRHAPVSCKLRYHDGQESNVNSLGHVELPAGLFTFSPLNAMGNLLRSFYPRVMLAALEIGDRIGDTLVAQQATTTLQVEQAALEQAALRKRKLGDILLTDQVVTPEQLLVAIDQQATMPMVKIGAALIALGFLTEAKLNEALQRQSTDRSIPLGELLVRRGDVTRSDLQTALARKMGYPIVDVATFPVEPEAALRLPLAVARRLTALPLMMRNGRLVVALEDPSARDAIDEIEFSAQCKILPVLARTGTLAHAVERVYQRLGKESIEPGMDFDGIVPLVDDAQSDRANKLLANLEQMESDATDDEGPQIEQSDNSLVRLINTMILEARQQGVSDIHLECPPHPQKVRVRFRKDGLMQPYMELPQGYRQALVARIKIMCDLDISERRKPQDGKINFGRWVQGQKLELRVATIPTANGAEDVVMRLLASARTLPLKDMGLQPDTLARLITAIERPYGMVLCVGPTGSGKTTTLHAALGHINTPQRKIWTAEDPVEITQVGLRQVQVNPKIGWTFAKALRAFLRADPDVVMVGEIRDSETAQMAIEASLTGHLVFSTLHTNSAAETITRLLDMGMDPFSFADSLLAVLAQRLVRRWCKHCVSSQPASDDEVQALLDEYLQAFRHTDDRPDREALLLDWVSRFGHDGRLLHHHAPGCRQCNDSGFAGRVGLHELLVMEQTQRHLVQTKSRADDVQREAMAQGMRTLRQDGILKVLSGLTSVEEVRAISNN